MNDILAKIGWGAVAVDGFIPPAAFMEFQAYKVLVIACDMRQIHHIEYTPAPDIVHEAAGHAPIIVDREYSEYLQRFGEVGAKAMSSKKDFELYQAIRHLSILKERPNADPKEVDEATKLVEHRQKTLGEPSEMALLSRLHWWTVEYGLIGPLENPKIYGAGLLSSIGESVSCLEPEVKKIPYSIDAMNTAFDITTRQPQLFVCRDFQHLKDVLEEFASKMAYQVGGLEGINKAIECQNAATCEYSSGLQVSGVFTEVITDEREFARLSAHNRQDRTGACATRNWKATALITTRMDSVRRSGNGSRRQLRQSCLQTTSCTRSESSKAAKRKLNSLAGSWYQEESKTFCDGDGKLLLITFSNCTAKYGDRVLFNPDWGIYDMAVGERITSVFNGAADKDAYNQVALVPKERTIKVPSDAKRKRLENLYAQVRKIRESQDRLRTARRDLGNTTGRASRRLAVVDGNFRNPRRNGSTARAENENRKIPEREESEDERSLDPDQLGIPVGRVPQETGIPSSLRSVAQVSVAQSVLACAYASHECMTLPSFVFKVPLALLRLCVFVLAQNIFIELHVGSKKVLKPSFDPLSILKHFLGDVISVDVDANRANDSEFLSFDRNRGAFEFSRADVQLVVQLVLVQELPTFQIDQQICCTVA